MLRRRTLFSRAIDRSDEAITVLGHRLDKARAACTVAELPPQRTDTLGERLVGHWHAAPDLLEESILRDELALLAHQQHECVEIAAVKLDGRATAAELTVGGVEQEAIEAKAAGGHVLVGSLRAPRTKRPGSNLSYRRRQGNGKLDR